MTLPRIHLASNKDECPLKPTGIGYMPGPVLCSSSRGGYGRPLFRHVVRHAGLVTCKACLKKMAAEAERGRV